MKSDAIAIAADGASSDESDFAHSNHGYTLFCEALNDNRLKAGMTLTQSELSAVLGISLSPLRETLVLLEDYGLIEIKQRAGIRIFYPEVSFIRENMQFRSMIEVFAIPVFARNVTREWLDDMQASHLKLQADWRLMNHDRDNDLEKRSRLIDRSFHASIIKTLGNVAIEDQHRRICQNIHLARKVHQTSFGKAHYLDTLDEHLRILDALIAGQATAAREAIEEHFRSATHRLFIAP
jgi:DNA-binding GntR family transcriptional regulator